MNNKSEQIDKLIKHTKVKIKTEEREKEGKPLLKVCKLPLTIYRHCASEMHDDFSLWFGDA